jgi:hypothetical protein
LFAASLSPDGRAAALITLAESGRCETVIIPVVTTVAEATPELVGIGLDHGLPLKDAPILGAAVRARADMLVTGDVRHFGHLYDDTVGGAKIVSPATALATVLETF